MGAPSLAHEQRVDDLSTLATLAGFTACVQLPWRLRPDVARSCPARRALFLGDAKATEVPRCAATFARLRWYATALRTVTPKFDYALVALAVDDGELVRDWERTLVAAFGAPNIAGGTTSSASFGDTVVVSLEVGRASSW